MPSLDTDLLTQLIRQKRELLTQLRDAGRRQLELIDSADMSQLLAVLSSKQRVLGRLQAVEQQLDPFRHQDPDRRAWHTAGDRHECAAISAECDALLAETIAGERQCEERIVAHRDRASAQLQLAQHASHARAAYFETPSANYGQLDLSSGT